MERCLHDSANNAAAYGPVYVMDGSVFKGYLVGVGDRLKKILMGYFRQDLRTSNLPCLLLAMLRSPPCRL